MDKELFSELIDDDHGVLRTADALTCMSENELRWRLATGKWQRPCRGLVVPHSGALTDMELLRVARSDAGRRRLSPG
jgi:hypothetical protein